MKITRKELKRIVESLLLKEAHHLHRCMDGRLVDPESEDCYHDIVARIEDAQHHRGGHSCGTESRIYYNGLLKGLRKQRNRLQKTLEI